MLTLPLTGFPALERRLLVNVTCPNCWHKFPPSECHWVSTHPRLRGDAVVVSPNTQRRFPPSRFTPSGQALDAEGGACSQLACPRCHLIVPRATLELELAILSVLGVAGSGKSVMMVAMIRQMRSMAADLGCTFSDADLVLNKLLIDEEEKMFDAEGSGGFRKIDDVVKKTDVKGERYQEVRIDGHTMKFVPPYGYVMTPRKEHPRHANKKPVGRMVCLYDNAGEHFMPGADQSDTPVTRHLSQSKGLIFTFDPTQHRSIVEKLGPGAGGVKKTVQQHQVLQEAANRIREHGGQAWTGQLRQPLVVAVTKFDAWRRLAPGLNLDGVFRPYPGTGVQALYVDRVLERSEELKHVLKQHCNDMVSVAESCFEKVIYVPIEAAGSDVRRGGGPDDKPMFRPVGTGHAACLPMIYLLSQDAPSLVLSVQKK